MFAVAGLPAMPGNKTDGHNAAGPNQVLAGEMGIIVRPLSLTVNPQRRFSDLSSFVSTERLIKSRWHETRP